MDYGAENAKTPTQCDATEDAHLKPVSKNALRAIVSRTIKPAGQ